MKIAIFILLFLFSIKPHIAYSAPDQKSATEIVPPKMTDVPPSTKNPTNTEKPIAPEPTKKEVESAAHVKVHEAPRVTNVYFYPSGGDPSNSNAGSDSGDTSSSAPGDEDSKNGVAAVALGHEGSSGNAEPTTPDAAMPEGKITSGPKNKNFQEWLQKHPDIKERVEKQRQLTQEQIEDSKGKLKEQFKTNAAPAEQ